ncbi:Homeobox protein 4 [Fusarium oxysporum f. sp. albedinis]|nr:Homeobox protein 4 [Fusarium oxysporum f. sp. albedinis]
MKPTSKLHKWEGPTTSEVMTMIGALVYMGVNKEKKIRSYWEGPKPGVQCAEHSFVKFISYDTFQLIHRHLRPFDHTPAGCQSGARYGKDYQPLLTSPNCRSRSWLLQSSLLQPTHQKVVAQMRYHFVPPVLGVVDMSYLLLGHVEKETSGYIRGN